MADFLKDFYQTIEEGALEPGDPRYVHLYEDSELCQSDPVERLFATIDWGASQTAQLFSGFRGTGKSTELRRLKKKLEAAGYVVLLCDMKLYLNLSMPVDVGDFLLAVAGAVGDALSNPLLLGKKPELGYWDRALNFLTRTQIDLNELGLNAKIPGTDLGASLKASIRQDPVFLEKLQARMRGHLSSFAAEVHSFLEECALALREARGIDTRIVVLFDSVEQYHGGSRSAEEVFASLETLFAGHAEKLKLPYLHVVYTIPPWLQVRVPNVGERYQAKVTVPAIRLYNKDGTICRSGRTVMQGLVEKRGNWRKLIRDEASFQKVLEASGGHIRDLFRILRELLILGRNRSLPLTNIGKEDAVTLAIDLVRRHFLPISIQDARWLCRVADSHDISLPDGQQLVGLARLFDQQLILCYANGEEWYNTHPLVLAHVRQIATSTV